MGLLSYLRGDSIQLTVDQAEDRALTRDNVPQGWLPYRHGPILEVGRHSALRVADAWACVQALSNAVAALPPRIYRDTGTGRLPVGPDQRLQQLLQRPTPGSTSADLFALAMVYLCLYGNAYIGKFRSPDGEVAQLACLHPDRVMPVPKGQTLAYRVDGDDSYGPRDIVHVKAMPDPLTGGLIGLSPVSHCRVNLELAAGLAESGLQAAMNANMPSGVLNVEGASEVGLKQMREEWRNRQGLQAGQAHSIAFLDGDSKFTPISFSAVDAQFLQQRELSTREICRIFGIPGWVIGAEQTTSRTYATVSQENQYFVTHSLRPWLTRFERAFSNDPELLPGGAYLEFDLSDLLRADPAARGTFYTAALNPQTGWMSRQEVRELENLPPEETAP